MQLRAWSLQLRSGALGRQVELCLAQAYKTHAATELHQSMGTVLTSYYHPTAQLSYMGVNMGLVAQLSYMGVNMGLVAHN